MTPLELLYRQKAQLETEEQLLTNMLSEYYAKLINRLPKYEGQDNFLQIFIPVFKAELEAFTDLILSLGTVFAGTVLSMAVANSKALVKSYFPDSLSSIFESTWETITADQIQQLITLPSQKTLPDAAIDMLKESIANKGFDGLSTAIGLPLVWALTGVRTMENYLYREGTKLNLQANDEILEGWVWVAKLDGKTCLSCWNKHGSFHSVGEHLNDHHNGRCSQLPVPKGMPRTGIESGEIEFNNLPIKQQKELMGIKMFEAYKAGKFSFSDLSRSYENNVYGTMLRQASLKELI